MSEVFNLIVAIPETDQPGLNTIIKQWADDNKIPTSITDPELRAHITRWGLPWYRAGAVVVNDKSEVLMVHEGRVQVKKIKDETLKNRYLAEGFKPGDWVDGDGGWNLPSGRLAPGETFKEAAQREVNEETGWNVDICQCLHVRSSEKPGNQYVMPVYLAEAIDGPTEYHTIETTETLEIRWLSLSQIRHLHADNQLRSPEFVLDSIAAFEKSLL